MARQVSSKRGKGSKGNKALHPDRRMLKGESMYGYEDHESTLKQQHTRATKGRAKGSRHHASQNRSIQQHSQDPDSRHGRNHYHDDLAQASAYDARHPTVAQPEVAYNGLHRGGSASPSPPTPNEEPYTYCGYNKEKGENFEFDDDRPLSRKPLAWLRLAQISTVFGGVAIIPCLISAYNFKGPNGGGQQLALWDFNGSTAFPLLVTTMIGWLWTFFLIGHAYLALSDPYRLLDKLQEKDFKKWWNIFAADTYAPIFTDILTCLLAWGAAGYLMYSQTRPDQCFVPATNITDFLGCGLIFTSWFSTLIATALAVVCTRLQYFRIKQWREVLGRTTST